MNLRISVITPVYNNVATIRRALESVRSQSYPEIEHIVVDGASTDGSLEVLREQEAGIDRLISEPDHGVYDALNKGIRASKGDVVGMLQSHDVYPGPDTVSSVAAFLGASGARACWGDVEYFRGEDTETTVRRWISSPFRPGLFARGWMPPHTAFWARRSCFEEFGLYDTRFCIASEWDLMFRFLEIERVPAAHVPRVLVRMKTGGLSNRNLFRVAQANLEILAAGLKHRRVPHPIGFFWKPVSKLFQYGVRG
jgi:glycosyltransferase involved in cell wall biosynthesis